MSESIMLTVIGIVLSVFGFFIHRLISQTDSELKDLKEEQYKRFRELDSSIQKTTGELKTSLFNLESTTNKTQTSVFYIQKQVDKIDLLESKLADHESRIKVGESKHADLGTIISYLQKNKKS